MNYLSNRILIFLLFLPCAIFAANPDGDLRIEIITAYNLVVDSNVETPATYGPKSFFIGAKICNDGTNDLHQVFANVGDYTQSTPGVYPIETTNEQALGYSYSGDFSLTHIADISDATRYIGTLPAGECATQYWLAEYPLVDANGDAVWGASNITEDDLTMSYDVWATGLDGSTTLEANQSRNITCRNEISAMANKIWPNVDNKVPDQYKAVIEAELGWDVLNSSGNASTAPGGEVLTLQGIWYDLGNINQGFDNNGDYVPDYNAWMQPVGDPDKFDPDCFRLIKTYGLLIIKLKTGGEYLIPFEDRLYFENIPENNGATGLVYYQFVALDGPCTAYLTPYQEVASGFNNEKFNGDFGSGKVPGVQSEAPAVEIVKTNSPAFLPSLPSNLTYTLGFTNTGSGAAGHPSNGLPLVIQDSIPAGTEYIAGSAASGNSLPPAVSSYTILYSTDHRNTWTEEEPATASEVTDIQWWLSDALQPSKSGEVTFQVSVPASFSDPILVNTGYISFGNNDPFDQDTAQAFMPGINQISGKVFEDDGGTNGTEWNEVRDGDEATISGVLVSLYFDTDKDGILGDGDILWSTTQSAGNGTYSFSDLPDGYFVVEVDKMDTDITTGYVETTVTSHAFSLDPTSASSTAVSQGNLDFGFGPAVSIVKHLSSENPAYEGDTLTFKLTVSNRSDIPLSSVPVIDTFDADRLEFLYAIPEETNITTGGSDPYTNTGLISWSSIGRIEGNTVTDSGGNSGGTTPVAAPLVAHWAFEEGSGTTTTDSSSSGISAGIYNGASWTAGKIGSFGLDFDGNDDYIQTGTTNLGLGTTWAVAFWINPDGEGSYSILTTANPGAVAETGDFNIFANNHGKLLFSWYEGGSNTLTPLDYMKPGEWTHIVVQHTGTAFEVYANGSRTHSENVTINLPDNNRIITIGRRNNPSNEFDGQLDDIRIYQDALTTAEILSIINTGAPSDCSSSVLSQWNFEEGTGTSTLDGAGTGASGTLVNSPKWTSGQQGKYALDFSGNSLQYVDLGSSDMDFGNNFAMGFWVKSDGSDQFEVIYAKGNQGTSGHVQLYLNYGELHFRTDGPANINQSSSYAFNDDAWHHVVINYDGNALAFYIDGELNSIYAENFTVPALTASTMIGRRPDVSTYEFNSQLDQFMIWDCPLSPDEITRLIETGTTEEMASQEVQVVFRARTQTVDTDTTTNYATVTGATFVDGRLANDDSDQATAIILNTGSISGYIWNDLDGAGWEGATGFDAQDEKLTNIRLVLHECSSTSSNRNCNTGYRTDTVYTDENGYYEFLSLREGLSYYIEVLTGDIPGTIVPTADPDDDGINSGNGGVCSDSNPCDAYWDKWRLMGTDTWNSSQWDWTNISFGYAVPPALYGQVWEDIDGDGIRDESEPGIEGVTVNLSGGATAVTDGEGNYNFGDLSVSAYTITVSVGTLPAVGGAWSQTSETDGSVDNSIYYTLTAGEVSGSHDFGFHATGASDIGDALFFDWNGNGVQDNHDEGIPGITMSLYRDVNANGIKDDADIFITSTSTDISGTYLFENYPKGDYLVIVDENDTDFPEATQTSDPEESGTCSVCDGMTSLTVDGTTDHLTADFGYFPLGSGMIGDLVWKDINGNGSQDGIGESGIAGITVYLYADMNEDGTFVLVDSTSSLSDGSYQLTDLPDGKFRAIADSTDNDMSQDNAGNRYTSTTPTLIEVLISNGTVISVNGSACADCNLDIDFGFTAPGAVGDMVFWDNNGNGSQDWNEEGIGGVTVYLCDGDDCDAGSAIQTAVTSDGSDGNPVGYYRFSGLTAGQYTVMVEMSTGILAGAEITADPNSDGLACDDPELVLLGYPVCDGLYTTDVRLGYSFNGADFGFMPSGVIGDYVWYDQNSDGIQGSGEPGHAGDTLWLCTAGGTCSGATAIDTAVTDFDGYYSFSGVADGNYTVKLEVPLGLNVTTGPESTGSASADITISGGNISSIGGSACTDCNLEVDFGLGITGAYSISGTVCLDDGSQDGLCTGLAGETVLGGTNLYLYNDEGVFMGSTTTDGSGNYSFTGLPSDTYIVSLNTNSPPLDVATLTTQNPDVPAGGTVTETETSVYLTIPLSATVTEADLAFVVETDLDFGDLSSAYQGISEAGANGARHILEPTPTFYLGTIPPDAEVDYIPSDDATGDGADEDGVDFSGVNTWVDGTVAEGKGGYVNVTVTGSGWLIAWIDFNMDGDFTDSGEQIISSSVTTGTTRFEFDVPVGTFNDVAKNVFARFRIFDSEPTFPGLAYTGSFYGGEVEDYFIEAGKTFPVEWLDFTVRQKDADAVVTWSTAQELNSDYFNIERSVDKLNFEQIGEVKAAGNSSEITEYEYLDRNINVLPSGVIFYRLRQVDFDGSFDYSNVVELQLVKLTQLLLVVYPNPADDHISIRYTFIGNQRGLKSMRIVNALGQEMTSRVLEPDDVQGEIDLDIHDWAQGYYYVQLKSPDKKSVFKLIVK